MKFELFVHELNYKETKELRSFVEKGFSSLIELLEDGSMFFNFEKCTDTQLDTLIAFVMRFQRIKKLNQELDCNATKIKIRLTRTE